MGILLDHTTDPDVLDTLVALLDGQDKEGNAQGGGSQIVKDFIAGYRLRTSKSTNQLLVKKILSQRQRSAKAGDYRRRDANILVRTIQYCPRPRTFRVLQTGANPAIQETDLDLSQPRNILHRFSCNGICDPLLLPTTAA